MHQQKLGRVHLELGALASQAMLRQPTANHSARSPLLVVSPMPQARPRSQQSARGQPDRLYFLAGLVRRHGATLLTIKFSPQQALGQSPLGFPQMRLFLFGCGLAAAGGIQPALMAEEAEAVTGSCG
jgi:hypothetical protein